MENVAVIGSGIAGCAAAYELKKRGIKATIFEKTALVGGRTATFRGDPLYFNTGAAFITSFYRRTWAYIQELGLETQVVKSKNADIYFVNKDRVVSFDVSNIKIFLVYPYLSLNEKLRVMWKTLMLRLQKANIDWVDPKNLAIDDFESVAEFSRRVFGENTYQFLMRQGIEPYWYFSAEEVSASMAIMLQANALNARFYTFSQGMDTIPLTIAQQVDSKLNTEIVQIDVQRPDCVVLHSATGETFIHDGVVIATTANVASTLINEWTMPITALQNQFLSTQDYVTHMVIGYTVKKDSVLDYAGEFHPVGDWDYGVAAVLIKGTQNPHTQSDLETVVVYLTEKMSKTLITESDVVIAEKGWQLGRELCRKLPTEFIESRVISRKQAIPIVKVGRFKTADDFIRQQSAPIVFAGDYFTIPCIEGAIFTAQEAVKALLKDSR